SLGDHSFSVKAQDSLSNTSGATSVQWTVTAPTPAPPAPTIDSAPATPTKASAASFVFSDSQLGVVFLCSLDGAQFDPSSSPPHPSTAAAPTASTTPAPRPRPAA